MLHTRVSNKDILGILSFVAKQISTLFIIYHKKEVENCFTKTKIKNIKSKFQFLCKLSVEVDSIKLNTLNNKLDALKNIQVSNVYI